MLICTSTALFGRFGFSYFCADLLCLCGLSAGTNFYETWSHNCSVLLQESALAQQVRHRSAAPTRHGRSAAGMLLVHVECLVRIGTSLHRPKMVSNFSFVSLMVGIFLFEGPCGIHARALFRGLILRPQRARARESLLGLCLSRAMINPTSTGPIQTNLFPCSLELLRLHRLPGRAVEDGHRRGGPPLGDLVSLWRPRGLLVLPSCRIVRSFVFYRSHSRPPLAQIFPVPGDCNFACSLVQALSLGS